MHGIDPLRASRSSLNPLRASRSSLDRWEVAAAPAGAIVDPRGIDRLTWFPATVPTTAASALRAAGAWSWDDRRRFDAEDWWWRTTLPDFAPGDVLGLDGIATLWDAWLDGDPLGSGDNMFRAYELALRPGKELVIRCRALEPELAKKRPRPSWRVPMLEQQQLRWIRTTLLGRTPGWSPRCPAVGPWRPVWIGPPRRAIAIAATLGGDVGRVTCRIATSGDPERRGETILVVRRGGERWAQALSGNAATITIAQPALWWPHTHGSPERYEVSLEGEAHTSAQPGLAIDAARGSALPRGTEAGHAIELGAIGFRTIELARGDGRDFSVHVNGVPVFCRGACWTPLDAVSLGGTGYAAAVAQLRDAGMNMIRISGTTIYEADALYDELDAQGVLLWQDLMFANMDYPDDPAFIAGVEVELAQQLARLAHRPSLAIVCGNSEGEQQAAMWGTTRDKWSPRLFHEVLPARVAAACPDVPYVPSSATGGAFPHAASSGPSSYYGVGAYMRPLDDARRAEVRFASECLAFANIPGANMPHDPRSPRDLGAGWTFDDVRDHYMRVVFAVDPVALRVSDHERYLALGRIATGEVMAQTFGEWRRARSTCGGGLIWFLRDLQPGAGWGVVDASGAAKPCLYLLSRALAPIALAITDEGTNGLALHVANDRPAPLTATLALTLWRSGDVRVGHVEREVTVPAHGAIELAAAELFDGFYDLSYAYRFGRPVADVVHAQLVGTAAEAFWCPAGWSSAREPDVGLEVSGDASALAIRSRRFALGVAIDAPGYVASDNYFHLAPGQVRTIALTGTGRLRATIAALNSEVGARFEPPVVASKS